MGTVFRNRIAYSNIVNRIEKGSFVGTTAEWEELSAEEKKVYDNCYVYITDKEPTINSGSSNGGGSGQGLSYDFNYVLERDTTNDSSYTYSGPTSYNKIVDITGLDTTKPAILYYSNIFSQNSATNGGFGMCVKGTQSVNLSATDKYMIWYNPSNSAEFMAKGGSFIFMPETEDMSINFIGGGMITATVRRSYGPIRFKVIQF